MLAKYAELADCEVNIHHLLHLFLPSFYKGTLIYLRHRGINRLVAGRDDKTNWRFWHKYFFVKIEHLVANPTGFPKQWNYNRKYLTVYSPFLFIASFSTYSRLLCF